MLCLGVAGYNLPPVKGSGTSVLCILVCFYLFLFILPSPLLGATAMSLPATSGAHGAMEKLEHRDAGRTTAVSLHFLTVLLTRPGLSEKKYLPLALILSERKENKGKHQPHHPN